MIIEAFRVQFFFFNWGRGGEGRGVYNRSNIRILSILVPTVIPLLAFYFVARLSKELSHEFFKLFYITFIKSVSSFLNGTFLHFTYFTKKFLYSYRFFSAARDFLKSDNQTGGTNKKFTKIMFEKNKSSQNV